MGEKLVVGPIDKGLRTDRTPFVIDNDNFPVLINAYQWRGRVKRKRGTATLCRLARYFNSTNISYSATSSIALVAGAANILTGFSLQANGNIIPGSVTIVDTTATVTYTDTSMDGTLSGSPSGSGTINYATGAITIDAGGTDSITATFTYYPDLPVMGLEDFFSPSNQYPGTIGFDTTYSYNILTTFPNNSYDVSFYKNPPTDAYLGFVDYVQKTNWTPTHWNGADYQQVWTVNYQGALWTTNGIDIPFTGATIGMQFKPITAITITQAGPPAEATITIGAGHGLVIGDFVFINEVVGVTGINFQTGYISAVATTTITVEFPNATLGGSYGSGGIVQYLTSQAASPGLDGLRWYDGDPTNGNNPPTFKTGLGWVNFAPPLSFNVYSISEQPEATYYLVGARMIIPFKDYLLFLGPVIQTSSPNSQIYLQDTVIYSQNGTPYYTCSFTGDPTLATTVFNPILVPLNQTATATAYFEDLTGYGGFILAGYDQPINTVSRNEDVLIVGFDTFQTQLAFSGNNIVPFNFFTVNSELGSRSTFSSINLDKGVMSIGSRAFVIANQVQAQRFDLDIPDSVFEFNLLQNGPQRVCAQRDFINEWIYFTYPNSDVPYKFPNQTLQYNYRDASWGVFNECYTTYGTFRIQTGYTWATIGTKYPTWSSWNEPWNAGASTLLQPEVIAGNQQGFVMLRDRGTAEGNSLYIQSFSGNVVTSPDHCLNTGDYIVINGCIGPVGAQVNGNIYSVFMTTEDTFMLNPSISADDYFGGGTIQRMYIPFIQTKQFPLAWGVSRKTRMGPQQYLLTKTTRGQITLYIYLSQDADNAYNAGPIVPAPNSMNDGLIYSTILYTCTESSNLGLTPANTNLQMISNIEPDGSDASSPQQQIWHRVNTSLIGDTVQLGFTLSDAQMRDSDFNNQFSEIELHSFILDVTASQLLS